MDTITLPLVLVTALIDSINPCAIGVLIFLIATLLTLSKDPRRMLMTGLIYTAAVYITYFLAGLGLIWFVQQLDLVEEVGIVVGALIIILGVVEMKDFFSHRKSTALGISAKNSERIKKMLKHITVPGVIVLGFFVAAVELPCTGGPYLAITAYLAKHPFNIGALAYLALYNFIFVLPLLIIIGAVYFGVKVKAVKDWKENTKKWMRLATGLLMIGLGILLILYARGTISFAV